MSTIKGRSDDMLIIRGVNLFHTQVEEVIRDFADLEPHYQLVVSREGTMDDIELKVEVDPTYVRNTGAASISPDIIDNNDALVQLQGDLQQKDQEYHWFKYEGNAAKPRRHSSQPGRETE